MIKNKHNFAKQIRIGSKTLKDCGPVFIVAEAGLNHNGSMKLAKKLIDAAKDAGADAVKFQTFKAEEENTEKAYKVDYQKDETGDSESYIDMIKKMPGWLIILKNQIQILFTSMLIDSLII